MNRQRNGDVHDRVKEGLDNFEESVNRRLDGHVQSIADGLVEILRVAGGLRNAEASLPRIHHEALLARLRTEHTLVPGVEGILRLTAELKAVLLVGDMDEMERQRRETGEKTRLGVQEARRGLGLLLGGEGEEEEAQGGDGTANPKDVLHQVETDSMMASASEAEPGHVHDRAHVQGARAVAQSPARAQADETGQESDVEMDEVATG